MSWTTPKTDWDPSYRWDKDDVNRIQDNLVYLQDYCGKFFRRPTFQSMRTNRTFTDIPYASDFNVISENFRRLNNATFQYAIPELPTFYANQSVPTASYFNTIESVMKQIKEQIDINLVNIPKLPIMLGNRGGINV